MRIPLYRSGGHRCSYLPERVARTLFVDPDLFKDPGIYGALQRSGFRRSGRDIYKPDCENCTSCIPTRIAVNRFRPRRSQRRLLRANGDRFAASWAPACFKDEYFQLYRRYLDRRHGDGDMANPEPDDFSRFLLSGWGDTRFLRLHDKQQLVAVAVTDFTHDAGSAVYTFFDPNYEPFAPGVYCLLTQITELQRIGMEWLYLGFWVPGCNKMEYKVGFRPIQLLLQGNWVEFERGQELPSSGGG